jgi:hypothetical protein
MISGALAKLPHRWRNIALFFAVFMIVYTTFQYIERTTREDEDYLVLKRKDLLKSSASKPFFSKNSSKNKIFKHIHGIDNFDSRLPRLQADFLAESEEERQICEARKEAVKKSFVYG